MAVSRLDEDAFERAGHRGSAAIVEKAAPLSLCDGKSLASDGVARAKLGAGHPLRGPGDSREQFGGGNIFWRDACVLGDPTFSDAHRDVDHDGCVYLHRDRVDVGSIESVEFEDLLEIEEDVLRRVFLGIEDNGEVL